MSGSDTGLGLDSGCLFVSGGQDGCVRLHDSRQKKSPASVPLHASKEAGIGALADICCIDGLVVTGGADKRICVAEARSSFQPRKVWTDHTDFIYSLCVVGDVCLSGSGSGMLLAHDIKCGRNSGAGLMWGLGASSLGAVQAVGSTRDILIAAADDGSVLVYSF